MIGTLIRGMILRIKQVNSFNFITVGSFTADGGLL